MKPANLKFVMAGFSLLAACTIVPQFMGKKAMARDCRSAAMTELKAPATASFGRFSHVKSPEGKEYMYFEVDAENSMGAKLRNYGMCRYGMGGVNDVILGGPDDAVIAPISKIVLTKPEAFTLWF